MSDEGRVWTVRQGLRYTNISDGPPLKTGESLRVVPESRLVEAERKWAEAVHDAEAVDEKLEATERALEEARKTLALIASCGSVVPGDCPDLARQTLTIIGVSSNGDEDE